LSNPTERARLLAQGPVEHADPGERSVHAHVHVRGSTVERLVQELDDQFVRAGVLSPRPGGPRNRGDLLGALERSSVKPVIVIDGLDEAASEAWQITIQVLSLLAGNACIIVATRDLAPAEDGPSLVETLAPQERIDLGDTANRQDATEAVRAYVAKRLAASVAGEMDTAAVAEAIIHLARQEGEGLFLLARVITSQLRAEPLDTSQPGWEARLSRSVEAAFTRDIERIPPLRRDDTDLPAAARELLTALAWSYGAGLPTDIWAVIATALSATQVQYGRDDVYWLLGHAGRYIVEDGEGEHAVYRLSHQRLVEHLHPRPAPAEIDTAQQQAAPVATALIDRYRALLASGLEPETPTYLWRYVWRHCADAGPVGIDALRQLAATNPAFLNDLASALNNLGNRYSEIGRRHEADLVWDDTLRQFTDQPTGFASLTSRRALARPANELPMACADLSRSLSRNDLPTSSTAEVRRACRALRQRAPSDFDPTWRDLTGELPAWLLIDLELIQHTLEWINTPTWQASCDYLREHAAMLLSEAVQPVFDELALETPDDPTLQQHRTLLGAAQQHGIDVAYRELLLGEVVNAWINTDTWAASRAFLDAHHADLASDEAMAILVDRATDGQSAAIMHHALLTLGRLDQTDRAYDAIQDAAQLQAELTAARSDADSTRLIAYATMGVLTASDDADIAQAYFHLALGQSLTNDLAINRDLVIRARELAPDQVPVWLGYISALLGARPDRQATLIPLSQTLLAPP
jgi:hypothetical protein